MLTKLSRCHWHTAAPVQTEGLAVGIVVLQMDRGAALCFVPRLAAAVGTGCRGVLGSVWEVAARHPAAEGLHVWALPCCLEGLLCPGSGEPLKGLDVTGVAEQSVLLCAAWRGFCLLPRLLLGRLWEREARS